MPGTVTGDAPIAFSLDDGFRLRAAGAKVADGGDHGIQTLLGGGCEFRTQGALVLRRGQAGLLPGGTGTGGAGGGAGHPAVVLSIFPAADGDC